MTRWRKMERGELDKKEDEEGRGEGELDGEGRTFRLLISLMPTRIW